MSNDMIAHILPLAKNDIAKVHYVILLGKILKNNPSYFGNSTLVKMLIDSENGSDVPYTEIINLLGMHMNYNFDLLYEKVKSQNIKDAIRYKQYKIEKGIDTDEDY